MCSRLDCTINSLFTNAGQTYQAISHKFCKGQNDLFESKLGVLKSADECKKKCTDNPKCVSAEWYGSDPTQCDTSSTCTTKNMEDAPKNYGVVFFVKQKTSVNTAGRGTPNPSPNLNLNLTVHVSGLVYRFRFCCY